MSANITNMDLTNTATAEPDRNVEIANLEFRVVEAAEKWRKYRRDNFDEVFWEHETALDEAVDALIAAREKQ
jgi:uncharacterized tellurite resistance protein B-like protein